MTALVADAVVDVGALTKVVWISLVMGTGVTAAASLAIFGATRFTELRGDGRTVAAGAFAVLTTIALAAVVLAVIVGIVVMTNKA